MSIDPNNLPEGRPVSFGTPGGNRALAWVRNGELHAYHGGGGETYEKHERFTYIPLVPVPDGMTPKDAQRILDEHVEWVPVDTLDGVREGAPFREIHTGKIGPHHGAVVEYRVHPDDVPDPDADLIEAIAAALRDYYERDASDWPGYARTALRVVREQEGQR